MRNLKKILALVLALVMSMSLMATANAFTDDASIDADYEVAAKVLADMGIFKGYPDGSFQPTAAITRQEVAAIMYRIASADVTDKQAALYVEGANFTDVKATDWSAGYIGYCYNGDIVVGNGDGTFGPQTQVTGYQVLAMALRAIGYDANGEFTGADWAKNVATTAQSLGILKHVPGTVQLSKPATRELVAELVFQTLAYAKMVEYTPAFGYQPVKVWAGELGTLGYEQFLLTATATQDVWGRPGTKYTYNVGEKATTILDKAVYTNTVAVDECDVAKALGLTKEAALEKAFIDGIEYNTADAAVTTNKTPSIHPYAYASKMGAQGRQLEIYKMGTAYRIVEINTYLGQVDAVTASKVDKNGHVTDATITVGIWADDNDTYAKDWSLGKKTTGYAVNDYVLVTVSKPGTKDATLQTVAAVAPIAGGVKTGWTAITTTVGTTTYADSDKFELQNDKNASSKNWDVILDTYGNLIGMVETTKNYLTIEAARWIDVDNTLYGGYVLANVYLADGTRVEGVKISKVGTTAVSNNDLTPSKANASFSDVTAQNDTANNANGYTDHLFAYSIAADGSYVIDTTNKGTDLTEKKVTISNKGTYMLDNTTGAVVAVNDNTVFMVADAKKTTYTTYVGKDNVPSLTDATVCYLTKGAYASVVLVTEYKLAANTFVAYVQDVESNTAVTISGSTYYAFNAYKTGETTATTVYCANKNLLTTTKDAFNGMWKLTVDSNNIVTAVNDVMLHMWSDGSENTTDDTTYKWAQETVANHTGYTLITAADKYWMNTAKYVVVTNTNGALTFEAADAYTLTAGTEIFVAYTGTAANQYAAYVYVFVTDATQAPGTGPVTTGSIEYRVKVLNADQSSVTYTLMTEKECPVQTLSNITYAQVIAAANAPTAKQTVNSDTLATLTAMNLLGATAADQTFTVKAGETTVVTYIVSK